MQFGEVLTHKGKKSYKMIKYCSLLIKGKITLKIYYIEIFAGRKRMLFDRWKADKHSHVNLAVSNHMDVARV